MRRTWQPAHGLTSHPAHEFPSRTLSCRYANPGFLLKYGYSLTVLLIVTMVMGGLGFSFVSSLRHFLWWQTMKDHKPLPIGDFVVLLSSTIVIMAIWYRIVHAALVEFRRRRQMSQRIAPLLTPLPPTLPVKLGKCADWYLLDDEDRIAFTWGLRRSRVAISHNLWGAIDEPARTAVVYHELAHVLNRDAWQQLFLQVLANALGPVGVGTLYKRYLIWREILADSLAIAACQGNEVPILEAMLAIARTYPRDSDTNINLVGALDARIAFMDKGTLPEWWGSNVKFRVTSTIIAVLLTFGESLIVWCH